MILCYICVHFVAEKSKYKLGSPSSPGRKSPINSPDDVHGGRQPIYLEGSRLSPHLFMIMQKLVINRTCYYILNMNASYLRIRRSNNIICILIYVL